MTVASSRSAQTLLISGINWNSGSPASNRTDMWGIVSFQFIVNDMLIQSLSISAVSGWANVLNEFTGPQTRSREPCGRVRNRNGVFQVMIPIPNWSLIQFFQSSVAVSKWKSMLPWLRVSDPERA